MFSEIKIKELIFDKLGLQVLSIQENTQGCDQYVWIILTSSQETSKIVLKHPKNEIQSRILREVLGCQILQKLDIVTPKILYWDDNILIETFIEGKLLDEASFEHISKNNVFLILGRILRKIHSIPGYGFGKINSNELVGEISNLQGHYDLGFLHEIKNLKKTGLFSSTDFDKIQNYFTKHSFILNDSSSVLLHADFADSNLILTPNYKLALIDFADLSVGNPMQDFAYMYEVYHDTPPFNALLEGYQDADLIQIEFFTFCRFLWLIPLLWKNQTNPDRLQKALLLFTSMWNK